MFVGAYPALPSGVQAADRTIVARNNAVYTVSASSLSGLSMFNVQRYGAIGDGVADDTAAIQAAANAVPASGGQVYLPAGTYSVTGSVYLKSNTSMVGDGWGTHVVASGAWVSNVPSAWGCFVTNANRPASYNPNSIVDSNISVESIFFDYGLRGIQPYGASHAIEFLGVKNVLVRNCLFDAGAQVAGAYVANDAVALMGCADTVIDGCSAYNFVNCPYDHWCAPKNARVVNCYAESAICGQMVNFNPEFTSGSSAGNVADGFVLANNTFVGLGAAAIPMQLEPLGAGTTVTNVNVTGNVFKNVGLFTRGATRGVSISNNVFSSVIGGGYTVAVYPQNGGTPDAVVAMGNVMTDPGTVGGNYAAMRIEGTNSVAIGNVSSGATDYAALYTGAQPVAVLGNNFDTREYTVYGNAWGTGSTPIRSTQPISTTASVFQAAPLIVSATGTAPITIAGAVIVNGVLLRSGPTIPYNDTLDSAVNIMNYINPPTVGVGFNFRIINSAPFANFIQPGTGVTLAGVTTVAASTWRDYVGVCTSISPMLVTITGIGSGTL